MLLAIRYFAATLLFSGIWAMGTAYAVDANNPTAGFTSPEYSKDQFVDSAHYGDGEKIAYVWTPSSHLPPKYVLIVMPGGAGIVKPELRDGQVWFMAKGNFLVRSRTLFADQDIAVITIDRGRSIERMRAVITDIHSKYPLAKVYIAGTSRSTTETIYLAQKMDGEVSGFIHSSSMSSIGGLDTTKLKSRNLLVAHKDDSCRVTPPSSAIENHQSYGTPLILMEGGITEGNECEAFAHHGFNGVELETVNQIKAWIRQEQQSQ